MFWTLLIGYVIFAQVAVIGVTLLGMFAQCDGNASIIQQLNPIQRLNAVAAAILTGIFLGPFLFPFYVSLYQEFWTGVKQDDAYWNGIHNQQVRASLAPLHHANIDDDLQEHFDTQSEAPLALGFTHLDDIWLKPQEPYCSKARVTLHPEGKTIAEIGRTIGINYCELISYLEDGTVVMTAAADNIPFFEKISTPKHRYFIRCLPGQEMDELLAEHDAFLDQIAAETDTPVRTIDHAAWKAYFQYHSDRFAQLKHEVDGADPIDFEVEFPTANTATRSADVDRPSDHVNEDSHPSYASTE